MHENAKSFFGRMYFPTLTQRACMTKITKRQMLECKPFDGARDMSNRKPFRTARQKADARSSAKKIDGAWTSPAPVSFHPPVKGQPA